MNFTYEIIDSSGVNKGLLLSKEDVVKACRGGNEYTVNVYVDNELFDVYENCSESDLIELP